MPFIGTQPEVGGYSVLDALTASATASYTLQKDSANFTPNSANSLLVSLNGVIQKPGSSFTVSGSTLTFSSALTSSDSIDFIIAMGSPLLIGTPSDGTVSTSKIADDAVTGAKIENNPTIAGNLTTSGTLGVTGVTTLSNKLNINFNGAATQAMQLKDTGGGNLASFGLYYNPSNTLIGNIQNANNTGIHLNVGTNGSIVFDNTGYTAANSLDDYEEGNWSPTLTAASSNPTVSSYDYAVGVYTKIGRIVHAGIYLRIQGGNMSGGSGDGRISGLPFASSNTGSISWGAGGFSENWLKSNGSFSANRNTFKPIVGVGSNVFELWQYNGSNPQYDTGWGISQIVSGDLIVSGVFTYITDA